MSGKGKDSDYNLKLLVEATEPFEEKVGFTGFDLQYSILKSWHFDVYLSILYLTIYITMHYTETNEGSTFPRMWLQEL